MGKMGSYKTTIRRGVVRCWNVYTQQWVTMPAQTLASSEGNRYMATLSERERSRIRKAALRLAVPVCQEAT